MNTWLKYGLFALIGGFGGYAYYHFIGCSSGACPITSNPFISTAYGGLIGFLLATGKNKPSS
jgi:hypothetical protein